MAWNRDDRRGGGRNAVANAPDPRFVAIQEEITKRQAEIEFLLGGDVAVEAFMRAITVALQGNDYVLKMPADSIVNSCMEAAQDRLVPDGVLGAIVPRQSRTRGRKEATWQPMYQGLLHLAKRYGNVRDVVCELVFEGEVFRKHAGSNPRVEHEQNPDLFDLGKLRAGYVIFIRHDGTFYDEVMSRAELLAVRNNSDSYKSENASPWKGPFAGEMYKKTIINRAWKRFGASVSGVGAEVLQRAVNRVYGDQTGLPDAPDTLGQVGVSRARIDERALPAPPPDMGTFDGKLDSFRMQLERCETGRDIDAFLSNPAQAEWIATKRRTQPEVMFEAERLVAAHRAVVDPGSRDDGAEFTGYPIFAPNKAGDWVLHEAGSMAQWVAWWSTAIRRATTKAALAREPNGIGRLSRENEPHFKALASLDRDWEREVFLVMRDLDKAAADLPPISEPAEPELDPVIDA